MKEAVGAGWSTLARAAELALGDADGTHEFFNSLLGLDHAPTIAPARPEREGHWRKSPEKVAATIWPMAQERTARLSASPPLFRSRFLDFFSRVHPVVPALIFIPLIVALVTIGAREGVGAAGSAGLVIAGLALWTLTEYWLHRKFFHWQPDNVIGRRMHFIIHGVHHDHPNDKMRLVMPPGASIPLAAIFFGLFWLAVGIPTALPLFGGFLVGYLMYDYTHYYLHHFVPKSDRGKRLREHHMRHHFQDHRYGFGVSSPIWDAVFGTLPRRRSN